MESAPPVAAPSPPTPNLEPAHDDSTTGRSVETALGSTIALLLLPSRSILALVPLWAVLCGACMAYVQAPFPFDAPQPLLKLLHTLAVVGVLWSTWRALLVDVDWAACFARFPLPAPRLLSGLPYATPWSPLGRLSARASQFRRWSAHAPIDVRSAWYTLVALPALILATSALAGWPLLVLSLAALALSLIEWQLARHQAPDDRLDLTALRAALQVGLGWLAGHVALAPLTWPAVVLACCYALAYQGALGLDQPTLTPHRRTRALLFLYGGQVAALVLLAALSRPYSAAFGAFLLAPQWLLLAAFAPRQAPNAAQPSAHTWYLQRVLPFCLVAMLAAAWASR